MQISDILSVNSIECACEATSKKSALEKISGLLSKANPELQQGAIFDCLLERERLGSTGLGHGIAIPHSRMENNKQTVAAFVQMQQRGGVDYDAPDSEPVDLFFCLLVPEDSTEEHLQILAKLAEMFCDEDLLSRLRRAYNEEAVFKLLTG